jgi:hypothetical protein
MPREIEYRNLLLLSMTFQYLEMLRMSREEEALWFQAAEIL